MDPELQKRLDQQDLEIAEIKQRLHKIDRHFFWGRVFIWLNVAFIVIPLIISYFYLMPILQEGLGQILSPGSESTNSSTDINSLKNLLQQYNQSQ